jgi:hypothetical protein
MHIPGNFPASAESTLKPDKIWSLIQQMYSPDRPTLATRIPFKNPIVAHLIMELPSCIGPKCSLPYSQKTINQSTSSELKKKMLSFGMWSRAVLVWTDVSEGRIASIFRVEKSESEELAWASSCSYVPPKRRFTEEVHNATFQKTALFIITAVQTSNITSSAVFINA